MQTHFCRDRKIILGNWKMNHGPKEMDEFLSHLAPDFKDIDCFKGIAPQAPLLPLLKKEGMAHHILTGAQNCSQYTSGAYTGEVSPQLLCQLGADFVIIGHSERREIFHESDKSLQAKIHAAMDYSLQVVFCIGEKLADRENGETFEVITKQLKNALSDVATKVAKHKHAGLVFAYEPVWAIGTGKVASAEQAQEVHAFIRQEIQSLGFSKELADKTPILYGGSVNANNAKDILSMKDIDGALVGGASLKREDFDKICRTAASI